ncbi:MAG: hypothetical protein K2P98_06105 [Neisseriaceae bacterium]|nr:hypothetical protein [Neisseriaceae bacterium]
MKNTLKWENLAALLLSLIAALPVQAASRIVVNGDFEGMGLAPYLAKPNNYTMVKPVPGYGWQTTDINGVIEVWNNYSYNLQTYTGYGGKGFFVETNAYSDGFLYQSVCLRQGESIEAQFAHRARVNKGEEVQYAIYKDLGNTLAFLFGDYKSTSTQVWDYHVTGAQVYGGDSGVFNLGFKALDKGALGNFLDAVEILLRPVIDLGPLSMVEEAGGKQLMLPLRVNGTIPPSTTVTVFIKDTGTIPRDWYRIDPPRFGTKYVFGSQKVLVTYSATQQGWLVTLPAGAYDGNSENDYVYLPVMLKNTWPGVGKISFAITDPSTSGSSSADLWYKDNPICEGLSVNDVEFKQSESVKQWYSDTSNTYTAETLESDTVSLSTHFNVMNRIGDVRATHLSDAVGGVDAQAKLKWSAAAKLDGRDWRTRKIYTTKNSESTMSTTEVLPLEWSTLSQSEQTDFYGEEKYLDYVKGDRTREMQHDTQWLGAYTNRFSLLGEVHSNVVVHKGVVYAQTGEGMLHAFDQETGEELWAYLPKGLLRLTNISERQPASFLDDDIAPLMTGKIALVKVGDEMVLLGNTGGVERGDPTQSRLPVFYAITVERSAGTVPTTAPLIKWTNYGRCNDSLNTSIPYCGVEPLTNDWKTGYLSNGINQAVAFMPMGIADGAHSAKRHALQVFSVATGESKILYTSANVPEKGKMTDIDFVYESSPLANYPTEKGIKEVYAGDTAGYIWRVSLSGLSFDDIQQISAPEYKSEPSFTASFKGDTRPISSVRVGVDEVNRGGDSSAPVGRMILFGTGNAGVRKLDAPIPDNGQHLIGAYFDATTHAQGASPVSYTNLVPQFRKEGSEGELYSINEDFSYSNTKLGWTMDLTNPVNDENDKEQIFASPYLFGKSALVYSAVPVTSDFAMTNFVDGYFIQLNVQTGKIEEPAKGSIYTSHLSEGVFAIPSRIFNEQTGNTHFNIKYASQEPYTESKVSATQAINLVEEKCIPGVLIVCSMNHTLMRLSVSELLAS